MKMNYLFKNRPIRTVLTIQDDGAENLWITFWVGLILGIMVTTLVVSYSRPDTIPSKCQSTEIR